MYVVAYRKMGQAAWSFTENPLTKEEAEGVARRYRRCRLRRLRSAPPDLTAPMVPVRDGTSPAGG